MLGQCQDVVTGDSLTLRVNPGSLTAVTAGSSLQLGTKAGGKQPPRVTTAATSHAIGPPRHRPAAATSEAVRATVATQLPAGRTRPQKERIRMTGGSRCAPTGGVRCPRLPDLHGSRPAFAAGAGMHFTGATKS
ncbi:hypothetical protein HPB47_000424 [Ixodes persulcatus]|uniref:Uncharacterized protein n=1 Tax=Ixodes persulcatus TaxID=34615 RepID=A0AC60PRS0_IXOPE|nr:hypothetical protein HPB47_000424 [Ixodes persulcatus]